MLRAQTAPPMRVMLLYGNCQVKAMAELLNRNLLATQLFRFVYVRSHAPGKREALPTESDFRDCAILCEQVDWNAFPDRDRLPPNCRTVRFPPLDSLLMWPFNCRNPYSETSTEYPDGRFRYGDRIVVREIDRGVPADDILAYYLHRWDDYKPNMTRVMELERVRLQKRDALCDVRAAGLVLDRLATERSFWVVDHPTSELFGTFLERILDACAAHEPDLRHIDIQATLHEHEAGIRFFDRWGVPVHPQVAAALDLAWYDPDARYAQRAGVEYSYAEYFAHMIRYCIEIKAKQRSGARQFPQLAPHWQPPLQGAVVRGERSLGFYPDGFIGKDLFFHFTATAPLTNLTIEGYCPAQHDGPFVLTGTIDGATRALAELQPGAPFTLECELDARPGQRVDVEIQSSRVMNLLQRGESEDSRDLSVLILSIAAR
jgi:hypothetical protein